MVDPRGTAPCYAARVTRIETIPRDSDGRAAASAIASLGALSGLAGAAVGIKSPTDQYVALLRSTTVADRLIDEFKLMEVYDCEYREQARKELAERAQISLGKKDGLITIEVVTTLPSVPPAPTDPCTSKPANEVGSKGSLK